MNTHIPAWIILWFISLGAGSLVSWAVSKALHRFVNTLPHCKDCPASVIRWMPVTLGALERTLYTLFIGCDVSGGAAFIGAWITIKAVGGWSRWSGDKSEWARLLFVAGLIGSAVSAFFGTWAGLL